MYFTIINLSPTLILLIRRHTVWHHRYVIVLWFMNVVILMYIIVIDVSIHGS